MKWLACALMLAACMRTDAVTCADGRTCPATFPVCDEVHGICLVAEQATVCGDAANGTPCTTSTIQGICHERICLEGCGDGVVGFDWSRGRDEACDDGNLRSHDGCSSSCVSEQPAWLEWQSPWQPRHAAAVAYDSDRRVIISFGGSVQSGLDDAHWERDRGGVAARWRRIDVTPRPSPRAGASLVYDPVRKVTVLFGGGDDTWEYDGATSTWREIATTGPSSRGFAAMFYDTVRSRVVLFGGTGSTVHGDTWEYDGATSTWTPIATPGPPARAYAAVAWDPDRQRAVLFGGRPVGGGHLADTWEWNGATATWTHVITVDAPSARYASAMAFSPLQRDVVLFGGTRNSLVTQGDFWQFDAATSTWTQLAGETAPPGRSQAGLVYDASSNALVLIGGARISDTPLGDVWEYSGLWFERTPSFPTRAQPRLVEDVARGEIVSLDLTGRTWTFDSRSTWEDIAHDASVRRRFQGVAFDSRRGRIVAFGGEIGCAAMADTIEWNRETRSWTTVATTGPSARSLAAMAYDPRRDVIVLVGGAPSVCGGPTFLETWEYSRSTWTMVGPTPKPFATAAFDAARGLVVALDSDGATWSYDVGAWTRLWPADAALASGALATLTFNPDRQRLAWYGPSGSDLELLELGPAGWERIEPIGARPPYRAFLSMAPHHASRSLVMMGGGAFGTVLGDTWQFSFRSTEPDEQCTDAVDNDGDTLVDASDPDCAR